MKTLRRLSISSEKEISGIQNSYLRRRCSRQISLTMVMKMLAMSSLLLVVCESALSQWMQQVIPNPTRRLFSVDFVDLYRGVATGDGHAGEAIYTTNGGATWMPASTPDSVRFLGCMQLIDAQTGYAAGATGWALDIRRLFVRTTNGGQSWQQYGSLPDSTGFVAAMSFVNAQIGFLTADLEWAYGSVKIFKTTNGGMNWTQLTIPDSINFLPGLAFIDSSHGFAVGDRRVGQTSVAVLLETTDGGSSWIQNDYPEVLGFVDIQFPNPSTGYALGNAIDGWRIYKTTNNGAQWFQVGIVPDSGYLEGIQFLSNASTGIVFGWKDTPDTLLSVPFIGKTTDAGVSWAVKALSGFPRSSILLGARLLTDSIAYICGGTNDDQVPIMLHTTNGGTTFVPPQGESASGFLLDQNYPNPFNPTTQIRFGLQHRSNVRLEVYNILGQRIRTLFAGEVEAGQHQMIWDGRNDRSQRVGSGVYFYRLTADDYVAAKKMLLLK